ncbi:MAG: protein kinase [Verrucomicrobia bacterium]|nr:protein kinase [Verrucomicrobiota bacterium]
MSHPSFNAPSLEVLGPLLPGYDFECLIAKGGMGAVYKAKQRSLARDVAIKILPREVGHDPLFRQSFETEARAMARLNHPNLIGVYDSGSVDDMLYIVMEYVPGKSLYHSSYGKQVEPVQAAQLVQGICDGLGHAHENGIIHRDIKPANILLTSKAAPKIGDFGLARPVESDGAGLVMGTPGYTAPEVITSPQVADRRSDLFAVGVILYELMTGGRQEAGAPPPSMRCGCGPALDDIWRRATHPNPDLRYPDAQAFSKALGEWIVKFKAQGPAAKGKAKLLVAAPPQGSSPSPASSESPGTPAAVVVPQLEFQVKTNWHFIRNLFIIAALIVVIAVVWKQLEVVRRQRDKANRDILEEAALKEAKAQAEARQFAKQPKPPAIPDKPVLPPVPKVEPIPETPYESLERLRIDLANGNRTEMPLGTVRRGEYDFFLVPKPMTWSEAATFAERFGGHLAIPTTPEDVSWFGQKAPPEGGVWIGAGRSGRSAWSCVDGTLWKLSSLPKGTGTHVGVNNLGLVRGLDSKHVHPFLIQWHRDGSNPASLAAALLATRESLTQANPIYPPGTETFESRHYLYVARPIIWRDAVELAEKSGGHLAVVVDKTEASYLAQFADSLVAPNGIWLGAFLKDKDWVWITGEPWKTSKWAEGVSHDTKGSALLIRPEKGWDAQNLATSASGFIIEWSKDREAGPTVPQVNPADIADLGTLAARAKELVLAADKKRSEQLAANVRSFAWDLDLWLRTLPKGELSNWQLPVAKLKAAVRNSRVPTAIPRESGIAVSPQMARIAAGCADKQAQFEEAFQADVDRLRVVYLVKLKDAVTAAEQAGKNDLATTLRAAFKQASDNDTWLRSFGIESKPAAPSFKTDEPPGGEARPGPKPGGGLP